MRVEQAWHLVIARNPRSGELPGWSAFESIRDKLPPGPDLMEIVGHVVAWRLVQPEVPERQRARLVAWHRSFPPEVQVAIDRWIERLGV